MLSKTVVNFLYQLLNVDKSLSEIIDSIGYSERFVISLDFEIMHKAMMNGNDYVAGEADDLNENAKIWTAFIKSLLTSDQSLEMIPHLYSYKQRYYIARVMFHMQTKLLEEVRELVDASGLQVFSAETSH